MNARFTYLLHRYVHHLATDEELKELKALLLNDRFKEDFKSEFSEYLSSGLISAGNKADGQASTSHINADELYEQIMTNVRHVPEGLTVKPGKRALWIRIAASVAVFLSVGWWWLYRPADKAPDGAGFEVAAADNVVRFTAKDYIHLPDGSTVLLNHGSELSYNEETFGDADREVTLTGEAYFDISVDAARPFVVRTGKVNTRVLGTAFNVNAREGKIVVTVTRGLVEVGDDAKVYAQVKPDERITINTASNVFEMEEANVAAALRWKEESMIFDGITLAETAGMIEERYQVKVLIANEAIKKCRINAWFLNGEGLDEILELVCGIRQASFSKVGNRITIDGGIGCEPAP